METKLTLEQLVVEKYGFKSLKEFHRLVADLDLSSPDKIQKFTNWREQDGTKESLLKLANFERGL